MGESNGNGPAGVCLTSEPGQPNEEVDVNESSAPHAHPSTGDLDLPLDQDDRPHACNDGWVTLGQILVDPETGEEVEEYALYLCRRCADSR
jgi:hypothetical protein